MTRTACVFYLSHFFLSLFALSSLSLSSFSLSFALSSSLSLQAHSLQPKLQNRNRRKNTRCSQSKSKLRPSTVSKVSCTPPPRFHPAPHHPPFPLSLSLSHFPHPYLPSLFLPALARPAPQRQRRIPGDVSVCLYQSRLEVWSAQGHTHAKVRL